MDGVREADRSCASGPPSSNEGKEPEQLDRTENPMQAGDRRIRGCR